MSRAGSSLAAAALVLLAGIGSAHAVPTSFTFTGRLLDGDEPIDGDLTLDLAVYETSNGGTPVWAESHTTTADHGLVAVAMGGEVPLDPANFGGGDLWLEVTVNSTVLTPRYQIRSVPYAFRAGISEDSEAIGGIPADQVQQVLDSSCTVGNAIRNIAPDGTVTCEPVGGGTSIPSGMVAFFDGAVPCASLPGGWTDYGVMNGRVPVGATANFGEGNTGTVTSLTNLGARTISQVPSHTHTVDPTGHISVDSGGAHTHTIDTGNSSSGGTPAIAGWANIESDSGVVDFQSQSGGSHSHTLTISSFNTGSSGQTSVDVTMPYIQLRVCRKN